MCAEMRTSSTRRRGVSLMELLVAIALGGVAVSVGAATLSVLVDSAERQRADAVNAISTVAARRVMTDWIASASLGDASADTFRGERRDIAGEPADELSFQTLAPTPVGSPAVISLGISRSVTGETAGLVLGARPLRGGTPLRWIVDSSVTALRIEYLVGVDSAARWLPGWISASMLPQAIRISPVRRAGSGRSANEIPLVVSLTPPVR
jgi:prepilin-type N-terminal cleavage/methylation domain-containing protein